MDQCIEVDQKRFVTLQSSLWRHWNLFVMWSYLLRISVSLFLQVMPCAGLTTAVGYVHVSDLLGCDIIKKWHSVQTFDVNNKHIRMDHDIFGRICDQFWYWIFICVVLDCIGAIGYKSGKFRCLQVFFYKCVVNKESELLCLIDVCRNVCQKGYLDKGWRYMEVINTWESFLLI